MRASRNPTRPVDSATVGSATVSTHCGQMNVLITGEPRQSRASDPRKGTSAQEEVTARHMSARFKNDLKKKQERTVQHDRSLTCGCIAASETKAYLRRVDTQHEEKVCTPCTRSQSACCMKLARLTHQHV
jgi:hypothetical protein